jgi:hypothetical protein
MDRLLDSMSGHDAALAVARRRRRFTSAVGVLEFSVGTEHQAVGLGRRGEGADFAIESDFE